ncbi:MAG: tetratricopeptide repeat protein, partial [Burkholderiales bacterium]
MTTARFGIFGRAALCVLLASAVACTQESPEKLLASAQKYFQAGDYKAAKIQLKNVLQQDSASQEARFLLGRTFLVQGDGVGAELELRKALQANYPKDAVVPELARALLLQGKHKAVLTEFAETTLGNEGANADLKTSIGVAHAAQGDLALAQTAVDAALALEPGNEAALLMQARLMSARGDIDGALKATDQLLDLAPKNAAAFNFKGELLLYAKRDVDGALAAFEKAVEVDANFVPAYSG